MYWWETRQIQKGISHKNCAIVTYFSLLGIGKSGEITTAIQGNNESCLDQSGSHGSAERWKGISDTNRIYSKTGSEYEEKNRNDS